MPSVTCTFPSTENPLTNGGNGAGTFTNTVSGTWTFPVQATAGSPGVAHGNGATGTNDAVAKCTGTWSVSSQVVTGTIQSTASPGAAEVEIHTNMVMTPGAPDQITTIEHDYTATILNIADWLGNQGSFNILSSVTVTQLITGDVIKADTSGTTARAFINNVQQTTGTSVNTGSGVPGIGMDNGDASQFVLQGFTATDVTALSLISPNILI
jgi:hypothetical protein